MHLPEFLGVHLGAWITASLLLGLMVGSFLNVVIHRIPIMLQRDWESQCQALLSDDPEAKANTETTFNLVHPNSHCPKCQNPIRPWQNIPILSYLLLKGQCAKCKTAISTRYPIIELATGILSVLVAWHFGFSWQCFFALIATWMLVALTMIDVDHQLLPDNMTLPLLWLGLIANSFGLFTSLESALWGAVAGYLSLWSIYWLFKLITGKEGMGYGDFKLLAALGAWLGWQALPIIILLSSLVGAVVGTSLVILKHRGESVPIPFGPYLAAAGWIAALWGDKLTAAYFQFAGLS